MAASTKSTILMSPGRAGLAVLVGAAGGAIFLFLFPGAAISTLMHHVLDLPGPGAGIALVLGPVALVFMLVSSLIARRPGGALLAALGFSVVYAALTVVLGRTTTERGMFGSGWFVLALVTCGIVADGLLLLARRLRPPWRFILAACGANAGLLVFYWIAIFPRTKGWVSWDAVPLLLVVSLAAGVVAGVVGWAISTRIPGVEAPAPKR